jgi:serine protease
MEKRGLLSGICLVFLILTCGSGDAQIFIKSAPAIGGEKWVQDEIVVKFKDTVRAAQIEQINNKHRAEVLYTSPFAHFKRVKVPKGKTPHQLVDDYKNEPDIEYAELNYLAYAMFIPNDPLFQNQWNFYNNVNGGIRANLAWEITTGEPNVIIAVVDTGVAYENYKSRGKTYEQAPELSQAHFVAGYDFVNNDAHPNDDEGHGTHVTGTLAQNTNNGVGPAGLAFGCSIMPVKVLNKQGSGTYTDIADGIYFAVDNSAKVINMSLGGSADSTTLRNACAYAYNHGVTVVCAAGNEYQSGNAPSYPAAYDAYCIAVGAVRFDKTRAYYSNTGSYLDIAAPGGDVTVNQNGDSYPDGIVQQTFVSNYTDWQYEWYEGTSMATPHVSAVAAMLISQGTSSPDAVRQAIQTTATDMGAPGWDPEYGWGVLDAYAALMYPRRVGDFTGDGSADFSDLYILITHWLQNAPAEDIAPAGGDGIINFADFAVFAQGWNN